MISILRNNNIDHNKSRPLGPSNLVAPGWEEMEGYRKIIIEYNMTSNSKSAAWHTIKVSDFGNVF